MLEKFGIGVDIVDVNRFREKSFEKNEKFYKKIFHDSEIRYCLSRANPSESFAARFAIKESVIKSIGIHIDFLDILIDDVDAKPMVSLLNNTYNFLVSLSHEKSFAIAVVIAERITK